MRTSIAMNVQKLSHIAIGLCCCGVLFAIPSRAADDGEAILKSSDYQMIRDLARLQRKGMGDQSFAARLHAWRSEIRNYFGKPEMDAVISERYIPTCYGGTIDMAHFLYAVNKVLTERDTRSYWRGRGPEFETNWATPEVKLVILKKEGERGYHAQAAIWDGVLVEGGQGYFRLKNEKNDEELASSMASHRWDCTPEDLPSEAYGALFAERLIASGKAVNSTDVIKELLLFIAPLKPLTDKVRKEFTYKEIALGFDKDKTPETMSDAERKLWEQRFAWFQALPLIQTARINAKAKELGVAPLCEPIAKEDPKAALAKAGLKVVELAEQYPLRIVAAK